MYELNIPLREGESPFYRQIYEFIVKEVRSGVLSPATRMPSTRVLAANLGVSRSTTQSAYDQLVSEGYLEAKPCKGYFIADLEWMEGWQADWEERGGNAPEGPSGPEIRSDWICDFSPRGVDVANFPYGVWRKLSREVLSEAKENLFNAGDSQGEKILREALTVYLHSARGVNCDPGQIVVGAGSEYLLLLLSQFLPGRKQIAMEDPTYKQAYRVFERSGYEVRPVRMDDMGMDVRALRESEVGLAYVMPSHQYPTGIMMPIKRRMEVLSWAGESEDRYLIEDDYDSEFRYRGKPVPALQGVDREDNVIYIGTFSRSVAPAIRISYMVLPRKLLRFYHEKCDFYASTVSRVDQYILARFLRDGYFERHLNKMRKVYRAKHDALLEELAPFFGAFDVSGENAGIHLLLTSKKGRSENWLTKRAEEEKIRVYGLSQSRIGKDEEETGTVLLGYANRSIEEIRAGVSGLARAWLA
ncbi:MAG: PLP-dependent aminotransferase family protein [Lachnospiraceae bacterium]|nr:PLP-dependent aminotransferase family protein [Lachnospiraceae bacterium]